MDERIKLFLCIDFLPFIVHRMYFQEFAFSDLTLLVGRQEEHLACKN